MYALPGYGCSRCRCWCGSIYHVAACVRHRQPAGLLPKTTLLLDRFIGSHFFDTQAGGSAQFPMHFSGSLAIPVYILVIPALAIASEVIPVFSRKAIFGYPAMVGATIGIGFVSMSVWAHHMFTIGMTSMGNTFFAVSTMMVGIPTGIKIFNWLGTIWGGKFQVFDTPMLFSPSPSCSNS